MVVKYYSCAIFLCAVGQVCLVAHGARVQEGSNVAHAQTRDELKQLQQMKADIRHDHHELPPDLQAQEEFEELHESATKQCPCWGGGKPHECCKRTDSGLEGAVPQCVVRESESKCTDFCSAFCHVVTHEETDQTDTEEPEVLSPLARLVQSGQDLAKKVLGEDAHGKVVTASRQLMDKAKPVVGEENYDYLAEMSKDNFEYLDEKTGKIVEVGEYLVEKSGEIVHLQEDIYLARASWAAQYLAEGREQVNISVSGIHQLHPVGSWREATWQKTTQRKEAIMASKDQILTRDSVLTQEDISTSETLTSMRSITPFVAIPFPYCGYEYVLLEGNGRLKGMQLAAEEDPALHDLKVEVTLLNFSHSNMMRVHRYVSLLWSRYVSKTQSMNDTAQIKEYSSFKMGMNVCEGAYRGFLRSKGPCPIVDSNGTKVGEVPRGDIFASNGVHIQLDGTWHFQACDRNDKSGMQSVVSKYAFEVTEICAECNDRKEWVFSPRHGVPHLKDA